MGTCEVWGQFTGESKQRLAVCPNEALAEQVAVKFLGDYHIGDNEDFLVEIWDSPNQRYRLYSKREGAGPWKPMTAEIYEVWSVHGV